MSTRLYVGNLSFNTPEDVLQEAFAQYGEVAEVKIMFDRETGRPRGFGFVSMADAEDARRAIEGLNNTELDGRVIRVNEAEERRERPRPAGGGGGFGGGPRRDFGGGGGGGGGGRGGDRGGFGGGGRGGRGGDRGDRRGGGRGGDRGGW